MSSGTRQRPSFLSNLSSWTFSGHRTSSKPEVLIHLPAYGVNILTVPPTAHATGSTAEEPSIDRRSEEAPVNRELHQAQDDDYTRPPDFEAEEKGPKHEPQQVLVLKGEVEARMPSNFAPRRILGLRYVFRGSVTMDMGTHRKGESDFFFGVDVIPPVKGVLRPGSQRFEFQIMCAGDLPATDATSPRFRIEYCLFAQLLGVNSPRVSASQGFEGADKPHFSLRSVEEEGMSVPWQSADQLPEAERNVPLLEDTLTGSRIVTLHYNPDPTRAIVRLDSQCTNLIPGLGMIDIRALSDVFTVAGPVTLTYHFPGLDPRATVFAIQLSARQKQTCTSPRDQKVQIDTDTVPILRVGTVPPSSATHPDSATSALWRGPLAGGSDDGQLSGEVRGRFPHSQYIRPSTVKEVEDAPITLEHWLVYEIWYSVHGEELDGTPVRAEQKGGAGATRRFRATRPVFFPSCSLVPHLLDLPTYSLDRPNMASSASAKTTTPSALPAYDPAVPPGYDAQPSGAPSNLKQYLLNEPCESCGRRPLSLMCKSLHMSTAMPHVRHDSAAPCEVCAGRSLVPRGAPDHKTIWECACVEWTRELGETNKGDEVQIGRPSISSYHSSDFDGRDSGRGSTKPDPLS